MSVFEDYPCVGVCEDDPDSGYCIGCGRPPLPGYGPALPIEPAPAAMGETGVRAGGTDSPEESKAFKDVPDARERVDARPALAAAAQVGASDAVAAGVQPATGNPASAGTPG